MKRCWFGGGILLFLLIAGLLLTREMGDFHRELGENMTRTAVLVGENRVAAQKQAEAAAVRWEKRRWLSAVLYDHDPMEQIEVNFALLIPGAETEDFRETCLRLASQLQALGDSQRLTLENLF